MLEHGHDPFLEGLLVVEAIFQRLEIARGLLVDPVAQEAERARGSCRRLLAGQLPRAEARQPPPDGDFGGGLGARDRVGTGAHIERGGEIGAHAGVILRAQRLVADHLDRVVNGAGGWLDRCTGSVEPGIVMAQLEREAVGKAAGERDLIGGQGALGRGHLDLLASHVRCVGGETQLDLGIMGDGTRRAAQHILESVERRTLGHDGKRLGQPPSPVKTQWWDRKGRWAVNFGVRSVPKRDSGKSQR